MAAGTSCGRRCAITVTLPLHDRYTDELRTEVRQSYHYYLLLLLLFSGAPVASRARLFHFDCYYYSHHHCSCCSYSQVRQSWLFRFDWFLKTRTAQELSRRVDVLARLIEKEIADAEAEEAAEARRKKGKATPKAGGKRPAEEALAPASKKRK